MQTYRCICGNRIFFENTCCLNCRREIGWCEACAKMTSLESVVASDGSIANGYVCGHADCRQPLAKCHNYQVENVCNRCFVPAPILLPTNENVNPDSGLACALCAACQITETIPDLSVDGNRTKWARLEAAKRRLLYTLDRLGLPYTYVDPKLSFDFKADVEPPGNEWRNAGQKEIVYTGHAGGKITINIREADDAAREQLRVQFHEAHRTLIGHFHHEIGHYYWDMLVKEQRETKSCEFFGDHQTVVYQDAMNQYYQNGPRDDWARTFISAYASAHPWEDFAETFALYLDIVSTLDTARHLFPNIKANFRGRSAKPLVERYQEVGLLVNEFNRTVGLIDLVPEVIVEPVMEKLEFIHAIVKSAAKPRVPAQPPAPILAAGAVQ